MKKVIMLLCIVFTILSGLCSCGVAEIEKEPTFRDEVRQITNSALDALDDNDMNTFNEKRIDLYHLTQDTLYTQQERKTAQFYWLFVYTSGELKQILDKEPAYLDNNSDINSDYSHQKDMTIAVIYDMENIDFYLFNMQQVSNTIHTKHIALFGE